MDSPTPNAAVRRQAGTIANVHPSIWGAAVMSVLVCAVIAGLYFQQRDTMPRALAALQDVQQARIDDLRHRRQREISAVR